MSVPGIGPIISSAMVAAQAGPHLCVDAVLLRPVSKAKLLSAVADLHDSAGLDGHKSVERGRDVTGA